MKIAIVVGNRPHFIKCAPFLKELRNHPGFSPVIVHSGQHYDFRMSGAFLKDFEFPEIQHNLEVGSGTPGLQTGTILSRLDPVYREIRPDCVVCMGDTNTTLAAALAAYQLRIPSAHIEAGMREHAWRPEEINKIVADHCGSWLFAPIPRAVDNLLREGIDPGRIVLTGDITLDTFMQNRQEAEQRWETIRRSDDAAPEPFDLATLHRAETVDDREKLASVLAAFDNWPRPLVFPVHPRTRNRIREYKLDGQLSPGGPVRMIDPLPYLDFVAYLRHATRVATDSSGVLKEAFYARIPCILLDNSTEYEEIFQSGAAVMAGWHTEEILRNLEYLPGKESLEPSDNPFGDGQAARKMVHALRTVPPHI